MRLPKWQIATGPGDFIPLVIACAILFLTLPPFLMLIFSPDRYSGRLGPPLIVILGGGVAIGLGFLVLSARLLSMPGSLLYRLAHGRIFRR
jgi:hypothetical protein